MNENRFASGWKRNYYGKGDVSVYRLNRAEGSLFAANVMLLIYGDAFWATYTTGDNTGLVATDSMKNFIQRETLNFPGSALQEYCRFLGKKFLATYPHAEGAQITAVEIPYRHRQVGDLPHHNVGAKAFAPAGPERAFARLEIGRDGLAEARSGIDGFRLLRLGGSAFQGFIRDEYTTLPELKDRPLHMWLDLAWSYVHFDDAFSAGSVTAAARRIVADVFNCFESGSIQQVIYQMGTRLLTEIPAIAQVDLEANNRTWDAAAGPNAGPNVDAGADLGVYTDARPPFGCLGLSLRR
jgi:urate oxidase/2-oxo-4-hydroxy-4-carboxy-5-ureidoimidazoline decarboxylase